jgi:GNAT superfamily N-acetyltransferase
MNITIREYQTQDLESCKALWRELTQRHRDLYEDPTIGGDDPALYFEYYLKKTNLVGPWVAEADSEVVGMAGLLMDGEDAEIEPVVVRSDFRSRGVGSRLIERLKAEAKARGAGYLSIKPVARNVEAIRCFYRAGFSLLGHIDMFLDLTGESSQEWKEGVTIHGHDFQY